MRVASQLMILKVFFMGGYLVYFFWQTKFKPYLGMALLCFLWAVLNIFFHGSYLPVLIIAAPAIFVFFYGVLVIEKWAKQGNRYAPNDKDIIVSLVFVVIYALIKLLVIK